MSDDDTPAEDEAPEVEPEDIKDLDTADEDDVKGGGGNTSGRCM